MDHEGSTGELDYVLMGVLAVLVVVVLLMLLCIGLICLRRTEEPLATDVTLLTDKTTPTLMTVASEAERTKSRLKSLKSDVAVRSRKGSSGREKESKA